MNEVAQLAGEIGVLLADITGMALFDGAASVIIAAAMLLSSASRVECWLRRSPSERFSASRM